MPFAPTLKRFQTSSEMISCLAVWKYDFQMFSLHECEEVRKYGQRRDPVAADAPAQRAE